MTEKFITMNRLIFNRLLWFLITFFVLVNVVVYSIFSYSLNNSSFEQNKEISKQINYNYESYFGAIIQSSDHVISQLSLKQNNTEDSIYSTLDFSVSLHQDIKAIGLYSSDSNIVTQTASNYFFSDKSWFSEAYKDSTTYIYKTYYNDKTCEYNAYISRNVSYNLEDKVLTGVLLIQMDFDSIIELAENSNLGEGGHVTIIDQSNDVIFTSGNNDIVEKELFNNLILGTKEYRNSFHTFQVYLNTITSTPYRIAVFSNIDVILQTQINFIVVLLILTIICIGISIVVCYKISESLTIPIRKLKKIMVEIEEKREILENVDLDTNVIEVVLLAKQFNKMLIEINGLMDQIIVEQKSQRMSELKSLQNQINPHFLYNTLDSIVWLAENNENEKVIEMTVALARLFRISISRGKFIIPVKDEIDHAKCYLIIQSIRYVNAFDYNFEVDESILNLKTMKLILQPLIENAIYHGLRNRVDHGTITVKSYQNENNIIFEVNDNGYGIRPEKIKELYNTFNNPDLNDGVGIKNVYQRLMIYFNGKAELIINSELDEGTMIKIIIPKEEIVVEETELS